MYQKYVKLWEKIHKILIVCRFKSSWFLSLFLVLRASLEDSSINNEICLTTKEVCLTWREVKCWYWHSLLMCQLLVFSQAIALLQTKIVECFMYLF